MEGTYVHVLLFSSAQHLEAGLSQSGLVSCMVVCYLGGRVFPRWVAGRSLDVAPPARCSFIFFYKNPGTSQSSYIYYVFMGKEIVPVYFMWAFPKKNVFLTSWTWIRFFYVRAAAAAFAFLFFLNDGKQSFAVHMLRAARSRGVEPAPASYNAECCTGINSAPLSQSAPRVPVFHLNIYISIVYRCIARQRSRLPPCRAHKPCVLPCRTRAASTRLLRHHPRLSRGCTNLDSPIGTAVYIGTQTNTNEPCSRENAATITIYTSTERNYSHTTKLVNYYVSRYHYVVSRKIFGFSSYVEERIQQVRTRPSRHQSPNTRRKSATHTYTTSAGTARCIDRKNAPGAPGTYKLAWGGGGGESSYS